MRQRVVKSLIKTLQHYPGSCCILTIASSDENWAHGFIEKLFEESQKYQFKILQNVIYWLQEHGFFGKRIQEKRAQRKIIHNRLRLVLSIRGKVIQNKLL